MHPEWLDLVRAFLLPGFLAQRIFLTGQFSWSPERFGTVLQTSGTVRNGSADLKFARKYFSAASPPPKKRVKSSSSCCAFSKPSKEPPCGSKGQGYKRKRSQKNDKGKGTSLPKSLNRQCKGMLSTREKVKLDVDYNLQKAGSFSAVCSWKAWPLSKSYLS